MLYVKGKTNATADPKNTTKPPNSDIPRGFIAEWTITILLLLFGTTTLVQAYVIPSGSMEDTLLIGDHANGLCMNGAFMRAMHRAASC